MTLSFNLTNCVARLIMADNHSCKFIPYNMHSYAAIMRNIPPAQELRDKFGHYLGRLGIFEILSSCP